MNGADGTGEVGLESHEAGRRLAVRFMLKVEVDRVIDTRYEVFGCGYSMAACAVAADMAVGYRLHDIGEIDADRLSAALDGLPDERSYCADLAINALHAAANSAMDGSLKQTFVPADKEHGPRIKSDHPVYRTLMISPRPDFISDEDRHLFSCLIAVASLESRDFATMLGLEDADLDSLLALCFPGISRMDLLPHSRELGAPLPSSNPDVLAILLKYVPTDVDFNRLLVSVWFAQIVATRAAHPGHLWVAMGLTKRPQLSAAIRRHLPSLAEANNQNMRWKRFLYKQVCDLNGGVMCKAPNCGICSDYHLCFAEEP